MSFIDLFQANVMSRHDILVYLFQANVATGRDIFNFCFGALRALEQHSATQGTTPESPLVTVLLARGIRR